MSYCAECEQPEDRCYCRQLDSAQAYLAGFALSVHEEHPDVPLDKIIEQVVWRTRDALMQSMEKKDGENEAG